MIFIRVESNFSSSCLPWISADKSGKRTGAKIQNRKNRVDNRVSVSRAICTKAPWNLCEVDERDVFFPKSKLPLNSFCVLGIYWPLVSLHLTLPFLSVSIEVVPGVHTDYFPLKKLKTWIEFICRVRDNLENFIGIFHYSLLIITKDLALSILQSVIAEGSKLFNL